MDFLDIQTFRATRRCRHLKVEQYRLGSWGTAFFYPEDGKDDDPADGGAAAEVCDVFVDASRAVPFTSSPKAFDLLERHHNMGKKILVPRVLSGHGPLKAEIRVRSPYALPSSDSVCGAQYFPLETASRAVGVDRKLPTRRLNKQKSLP
jgi:hypothetical protein